MEQQPAEDRMQAGEHLQTIAAMAAATAKRGGYRARLLKLVTRLRRRLSLNATHRTQG
jgi:hypothetical protein